MPLDNYFTKPDFSRQIKQHSQTTAILSGSTNILETFSIKNIEIDTTNALDGNVLIFDGTKFLPSVVGSFASTIIQGLVLTYDTGLTYNVSEGSYRIGSITYPYTGGSVTILSGETGGSRFDMVYITSAQTALVRSGQTATNPVVPALSGGELQIGIILVPVSFTGGTGTTVIQTTADTTFEFYNAGTGIQRSPNTNGAQAPGQYSFALARQSIAYGQDSSALGYYTRASGDSQTVVGQFNIPNKDDFFIVGNGVSDGSRSNAFRVTTAGTAYVQNKLFVTNVEIETTGASNNQIFKFDGTKFKPQLETITGLTLLTGGTNFISSITNNSLIIKSLTGGTGITITENNGLITLGLELSGTNAVTLIQSLTGGTSIISAKTGTTYFLYPIQGSGGTSVGLTDNKVTIYSDPISLINGANVGAGGAGVFSTKSANELQFRRLSSATPSNLSINQSGELVVFSANPTLDRVTTNGNITTNNIGISQLSGTSIFLSSAFTFVSGYTSYSNPNELRVLLADDLGSIESQTDIYQLNYFTENVTKGINPLTRGAYSAFTGGPIFGYIRSGTSITVGKESFVKITGITSGDTAIGTVFRNRFETKDYNANNRLDNTTKNTVGTVFFNQFDSSRFNTSPVLGTLMETHLLGNRQPTFHNEVRNLQLGVFDRGWAYNTNVTTLFDLYINRPLHNAEGYNGYKAGYIPSLAVTKHAGIFIESRYKQEEDDVLGRPLKLASSGASVTYTNTPWSLFAEADRAYIGNTLVLASAQTLASTTRGAWLDIGASQATRPHINFSAGTNPSSSQVGDLWWNGTQLNFRTSTATLNLLAGISGGTSGITGGQNSGSGSQVYLSASTDNLFFRTLSSATPSNLSINQTGNLIIFSATSTGSGGTLTGNFVPLTGTTSGSPMQGNLVFSGTNGVIFENEDFGIRNSLTSSGLTLENTLGDVGINIAAALPYGVYSNLVITDVPSGNGYIPSVTDITSQGSKFIKVTSDGVSFDFHEDFIDITETEVNDLRNDNNALTQGPLIKDRWYRIIERGTDQSINFNTFGDIFFKAISSKRFSPDGYLLQINADWQNQGNYGDVDGGITQLGLAYYGLEIPDLAGSKIVIYNNRHWKFAGTAPYTITDVDEFNGTYFNFEALPKDYTSNYGYIIEPVKIFYDWNDISSRPFQRIEDKRGNIVNNNTDDDVENFRFGHENVRGNFIASSAFIKIQNYYAQVIPFLFRDNQIFTGSIGPAEGGTNLPWQLNQLTFDRCIINDANFSVPQGLQKGFIINNTNITGSKFENVTIQLTLSGSNVSFGNTNSQAFTYNIIIDATGGTFNGIVTGITSFFGATDISYPIKYRIYNDTGVNITFRNSTNLKTEGGIDAIVATGGNDNIEFYAPASSSIYYQTDINNYV